MAISIIGGGRVGGALADLCAERGLPCHLITRDAGWEALGAPAGEPVLVTVRNDDLDGVLARLPAQRRGDLVLIQNGMLRPWIRARGLDGVTRGLLFFAVSRRGDRPEPGGASPFTGPHAEAVVAWLSRLEIPAEVVGAGEFAAVELEKLIWNSAFGLLCQVHAESVGTIVDGRAAQLRALVAEMAAVGEAALAVPLELDPLFDRLCAYSRSIASYRGAVKEWPWRNGWFVQAAKERAVATPVHDGLLAQAGLAG
ncbi:MAG: ketopantoate reductase C-terminal domain-containing protein [Nannocystaceae bacterium]